MEFNFQTYWSMVNIPHDSDSSAAKVSSYSQLSSELAAVHQRTLHNLTVLGEKWGTCAMIHKECLQHIHLRHIEGYFFASCTGRYDSFRQGVWTLMAHGCHPEVACGLP